MKRKVRGRKFVDSALPARYTLSVLRRSLMLTANDLRVGKTFEMDDGLWMCVQFEHIKPGKGTAFVRVKVKNLETGSIVERTFRPEEKFKQAFLDYRKMQYLYNSGEDFFFMDQESFDQISLSEDDLGDTTHFLKENMIIEVAFYKGRQVGIELPTFVELRIVETEPGFKGDTAQNTFKPAKLESGYTIQVPLFVEQGEVIKVDTRTGQYLERVGK